MVFDSTQLRDEVLHDPTQKAGPFLQSAKSGEDVNCVVDACVQVFLATAEVRSEEDTAGDDGDDA